MCKILTPHPYVGLNTLSIELNLPSIEFYLINLIVSEQTLHKLAFKPSDLKFFEFEKISADYAMSGRAKSQEKLK